MKNHRPIRCVELEDRITPDFSPVISGSPGSLVITHTGGSGNDFLKLFYESSTGKLYHETYSFGLVSGYDFDIAPGEQAVLAKDVASVVVIGNGGSDTINIYGVPVNGSLNVEDVRWFPYHAESKHADIVVTSSKLTVSDVPTPSSFALNDVKYLWLGGSETFDGDNTFDASGFTSGYSTIMQGLGGNDVFIGSPVRDWIMPGSGANTVIGNGGGDSVESDSGLDTLTGGPGPGDQLFAENITSATFSNSSCTINGITTANGFESVSLTGTPGNDHYDFTDFTSYQQISMEGLDGNDMLLGAPGPGANFGRGGNGNDTITGGSGSDYLDGEAGDDIIQSFNGGDQTSLSGGADNVDLGTGDDSLIFPVANTLSYGPSQVILNGIVVTVAGVERVHAYGTAGNDTFDFSTYSSPITNSSGVQLHGNAGDDVFTGSKSWNIMYGGDGNDIFVGGENVDWFYGDGGTDTYFGNGGNDSFTFGATADHAYGGAGYDFIYSEGASSVVLTNTQITINGITCTVADIEYVYWDGTTGADNFNASAFTIGNVDAFGSDGDDTIRGPAGNTAGTQLNAYDLLNGGNGNDTLYSGANNCYQGTKSLGGLGDDTLYGSTRWDTLDGDFGNDTFYDLTPNADGAPNSYSGSYGNDIFNIAVGKNTVTGFNDTDTLNITATSGNDAITVANGSVTINGLVTTYATIENLTIDAAAGFDTATQSGTSHPIAYKINGLEPAVNAGPDVTTLLPVTRTGSFVDLGVGQSWTGEFNFGSGWQPILVDSAKKTFTVTTNISGVGNFTTTIRITDNQGNQGTDSFVVARRPGVNMIVGPTASMPTLATAYFHDEMTFNDAFFTLQRISPGPMVYLSATSTISTANGGSKASITMNGLTDGIYRFTLLANDIHDSLGFALDGNGDGVVGDNHIFEFHRLFGDFDSNRTVDAADFAYFGSSFGLSSGMTGWNSAFDFNADGTVDALDFGEFGNRFGVTL